MRTGGGKSLLFMLPAPFKYSGTTIITVLLSLRQDPDHLPAFPNLELVGGGAMHRGGQHGLSRGGVVD
jgi:hypothetical protein